MSDDTTAHLTVDRHHLSAPATEAREVMEDRRLAVGNNIVITRRGEGLLRWDASTWEVVDFDGVMLPWMLGVGFGITRRSALRSMKRDLRPALSAPSLEAMP